MEWKIDLFRPTDAQQVVALYRAIYGEYYPVRSVYDPETIIKQSAGDMYRVVARTEAGEIVGQIAFYRSSPPNKDLYEYGQMMVRHDYRETEIAFQLADFSIQTVPSLYGIESIWGEAVCNHTFTQRMCKEQGFWETALELDLMPGIAFENALSQPTADEGRISTIVLFRLFARKPQVIYLPAVYGDRIRFLYDHPMVENTYLPGEAPLGAGKTQAELQMFGGSGVARITVHAAGGDLETVLEVLEKKAISQGSCVCQIFFPLTTPDSGTVANTLRNRGYFLGGVLPRWFGDDGLLMQKISHPPNFDGIELYGKRAKQILALLKEDWMDVTGEQA
ncbi:MAG TPA: GNAT family N-acetyltransferase [Patescibacteria group bacterium]|nr:GNAT family N-acetyltransferase [Patescibacteria group bacterium]